jgi:methionine synthase / methylenetetrahydrofolate reductase(NADPH)
VAVNPRSGERSLLEALAREPLVFDGAMGTQIYERGVLYSALFEGLNVSRPELIGSIHRDYVNAGATVIETNTFGANALRLERHGAVQRVKELNRAGVLVAREAVEGRAYVVGAMGPSGYFLGEAGADDLAKVSDALREQADALCEAGVDGLVVETMRQPAELRLGVEAALAASGGKVPVFAIVTLDEAGRMADGTDAAEIARRARDWGAHVVGVNCSDGPMHVLEAVRRMTEAGLPVVAYPNAGLPQRVDDRMVYVTTPEYFGVYARRMFKVGVAAVGGCCGTTPDHIKRVAAAARMAKATESEEGSDENDSRGLAYDVSTLASVHPPPVEARSPFGAKIGKQFVVSVEVNPPVGLDLAKTIATARSLVAAGVDVVNIADGARAQARMSNLAMAARLAEAGVESILHVCGRDRNLLAQIAHLIGAHALGIRNLVVITGDPPKMGDFPDSTAVYDLDSIGLLKLATRLNHGVDPAGKPLGSGTSFVLATGAEPAALDYDRELRRLREKKLAGAEVVMTQPVYDAGTVERFLRDAETIGIPVLLGLLPLASSRNAEFLHNEVPGMQIPEPVRERMRKAGSGPGARKEGVAIAREMLEQFHGRIAGAYVMPPLERHELALEVVDGYLTKP